MANNKIDPDAKIGKNTTIGEYAVISKNVSIGEGCLIGHHVVIHEDSNIGDNVRIDDHTVIGKTPMRAANSAVTKDAQLPPCEIDSDCIIGTGAILYRGSTIGRKVLIADLATVRENVIIGDFTIVGRGAAIENFCTIGRYCKLETNVYITAYSNLADRVFVAPCVATSNDNFVGRTEKRFEHFKGVIAARGARIGVNATILPGKIIGEDALVAAGALVTKDVPPQQIVANTAGDISVKAKPIRSVPDDQLLDNQDWPE
ncbi:MAG: DapH/DapD/GlmU-related protein [Candidatus Zixiibacteriota bacterium]